MRRDTGEVLMSMGAIRDRYRRELLDVTTDLCATIVFAFDCGCEGTPDSGGPTARVRFADFPVSVPLEKGPWTRDELGAALGASAADLETLLWPVHLALSPALDHDRRRTGDELMIILPNADGEFTLYGYAERADGRAWSPESVLAAFRLAPNARRWPVGDAGPLTAPADTGCTE